MPTAEGLKRHPTYGWGMIDVDGKEVGYARISTISNGLKDNFHIVRWQKHNVAKGVALAPDLANRINHAPDGNALDILINEAEILAGGQEAANHGTAIHDLTDRLDKGEPVQVPAEYAGVIQAYVDVIHESGIKPHSAEQFVINDDLRICGSYDRAWYTPDGRILIGDLKTGKSAPRYSHQVAMQLAMYANATALYDPITKERTPLHPHISKKEGLLIHAPLTGGCSIYEVELEEAWHWAQQVVKSRAWQKTTITKRWSK